MISQTEFVILKNRHHFVISQNRFLITLIRFIDITKSIFWFQKNFDIKKLWFYYKTALHSPCPNYEFLITFFNCHIQASSWDCAREFIIHPANFVCDGNTVFTVSVRPPVRPCFHTLRSVSLKPRKVIAGFSFKLANMFIYARQIQWRTLKTQKTKFIIFTDL